ncbi:MAG: UDP-N-acetylmuramoyl-tripeptide--D-alanyl-D-alanine ligase [Betaproteobacteria bacterium]|nr:UDP-N-acetylmuramoyl-tripeptide--D-alanyl-D-alanine ligase [Betaproteobacteria bacterium]
MDLFAAAAAMGGALHGENAGFSGVSTDSRNIAPGQLFFALRGDKFDGHEFVAAAGERGAAAAVVAADTVEKLGAAALPLIAVADTRLALGALAANWRGRFAPPLIAVTGSNGKTTTKEMIASILEAAFGDAVLATRGNFNNDIGLPLTLLGMSAAHRAVIVELGMNRPGEIAYLAGLARPGVALVTNVQRAHLAGMGTLETIAREKGAIYASLGETGVAVFDAADEWADLWRAQSGARRTMTFALESPADVRGGYVLHGLETRLVVSYRDEQVEVGLALPGSHNARNAIAAAAAALAAGVSLAAVRDGLAAFRGINGRLQRLVGMGGAVLLDDTYNANPDSVRAAIDVLAATVGKKILVLGDMGELGWMSGQLHDEIGGYAKSQGVDRLFALGECSRLAAHNFGAGGRHFKKIDDLIKALKAELAPDATVLVKGSRFMRMERVVQAIMARAEAESASCC